MSLDQSTAWRDDVAKAVEIYQAWRAYLIPILFSHSDRLEAEAAVTAEKRSFIIIIIIIILVGGRGGNASCTLVPHGHRVWDFSTACRWAFSPVGQNCRLTYPLKPSHAGDPGHIPL